MRHRIARRESWSAAPLPHVRRHDAAVYDTSHSVLRAILEHAIRSRRLRRHRILFLCLGGYIVGLTSIPVLYINEIWPSYLRAKGTSIFWATQAVAVCFNQYVNPIALERIMWRYYLVYLGKLVAGGIFMFLYVPETKGLLLEEVRVIFDRQHIDASLLQPIATRENETEIERRI